MPISDEIIPISALKDNYIWLFFDNELREAWIIDPGEASPVLDFLKNNDLNLSGIFITHHHYDHTNGVTSLLNHYPQAKVYASHRSQLSFITHRLHDNDKVTCSNIQLTAIEIPGHTLDHTAFYGNNWLFSGDTLFSVGCGRIFEGTPAMMYESLQKLKILPDHTNVFCGHEYTFANLLFAHEVDPTNTKIKTEIERIKNLMQSQIPTLPSTLFYEKTLNPFLRCEDINIIHSAEQYAGQALSTSGQVFAVLRQWKNAF